MVSMVSGDHSRSRSQRPSSTFHQSRRWMTRTSFSSSSGVSCFGSRRGRTGLLRLASSCSTRWAQVSSLDFAWVPCGSSSSSVTE